MLMVNNRSEALDAGVKERLLEVRNQLRKRTPKFIRAETHKRKRVKKVWRYPRGLHLKMGEQKRGARKRVEPGFRAPALVRGLSPSGHESVIIHRPEDIEGMDSRTQAALLSATLGVRKRVEAVKAALKSNITILNLRDPEAFLEGVRERFAKKKAAKKEKLTEEKKAKSIEAVVEKEAKPASTEEKPELKKAQKKQPKAKPAKDVSAEEKAKQEQKERDRLLTKKT